MYDHLESLIGKTIGGTITKEEVISFVISTTSLTEILFLGPNDPHILNHDIHRVKIFYDKEADNKIYSYSIG